MKEDTGNNHSNYTNFKKKVWIITGIVLLVTVLTGLFIALFNVLLLILAGALIALYFHGLGNLLQRKLRLPHTAALIIAVIGSILLVLAFLWFAGSRIQPQVSQLSETLPAAIEEVKNNLNQSTMGKKVVDFVSSNGNSQKTASTVRQFFSSTFGVLADVYVILFIGIFFTASPKVYIKGCQKLVPAKAKSKTDELVHKTGNTLTNWLKGKLLAMLVVAVLTAIGLLIMGVPMAFTLAVIAGLLNFIPNFGPVIAMIPAALVGLQQDTTTALLVIALYIVIQVLESNLITPQIQKRLISFPPALIIIAQLFLGELTGGWGLVLATPVVAILLVVLQELWIKKQEQAE